MSTSLEVLVINKTLTISKRIWVLSAALGSSFASYAICEDLFLVQKPLLLQIETLFPKIVPCLREKRIIIYYYYKISPTTVKLQEKYETVRGHANGL